jgi:TolA-binding protein
MAESYRALGQKEKACDYYAKVVTAGSGSDSFTEASMLQYAALSYSLERYEDAYNGYSSLLGSAQLEDNVYAAKTGMMRSAYRARLYDKAIAAAETLKADSRSSAGIGREADYVKAKSLLGTSRRSEAFEIMKTLAKTPSDAYGAESAYLLIQDIYDRGEFDKVSDSVYSFSQNAGDQSYWLAKAFIVLGDSFAEQDNMAQAEATFRSIADGYVSSGDQDDVLDNVNMRLEKIAELKK